MVTTTDKLKNALQVFEQRLLGEPWAFGLAMDYITKEAIAWSDIATEALKQYKRHGAISLSSIASATGKPIGVLSEMAQQNADTSLVLAASILRDAYASHLKYEWALSLQRLAPDKTADELARMEAEFYRLRGMPVSSKDSDGMDEFEARLSSALIGEMRHYDVTPPLRGLSALIPYHQPGDYLIFAGRPGMGKSYIGLNYVYHMVRQGKPAALYNMENTPSDLVRRLWSMHTGIEYRDNMKGYPADVHHRAATGWEEIKKMPVYLRTPKRSIESVMASIRRDIVEHGIVLAVVDYVQLIKSGQRNRVDDVAQASAELRELALQEKIVVVALAQLNREAESRADNRPMLSDLRNAGDLEQDAVVVGLLFRPEYYNKKDDHGNDQKGYAEIIVAKGRNSGTGVIECNFDHVRGFTNLDTSHHLSQSHLTQVWSQHHLPQDDEAPF
jgi:replicative DNA helicase